MRRCGNQGILCRKLGHREDNGENEGNRGKKIESWRE